MLIGGAEMKKYSDNKPMNARISIDYKQSEVYFSSPQRKTKRRECKEKVKAGLIRDPEVQQNAEEGGNFPLPLAAVV